MLSHHRDTASFAFDRLENSTPSETDEINLVPLVDVVFLLLFFMVTTTFSKESRIKVQLPEATSAKKPMETENLLIIQISGMREYAAQGTKDDDPRQLPNQRIETLQRALEQSAGVLTDPVVLIRADRLAPMNRWSGPWMPRGSWGLSGWHWLPTTPSNRSANGQPCFMDSTLF